VEIAKLVLEYVKALAWPLEEVIKAAEVLFRQYLAWLSWGFGDDWKPSNIG
jgi:hypothetical protein